MCPICKEMPGEAAVRGGDGGAAAADNDAENDDEAWGCAALLEGDGAPAALAAQLLARPGASCSSVAAAASKLAALSSGAGVGSDGSPSGGHASSRDAERGARGERRALEFAGRVWHAGHLRCYTCNKPLAEALGETAEERPRFDPVASWPLCADCSRLSLAKCPACLVAVQPGEPAVELAGHRRWHAAHLACRRCGATDGAALERDLDLAGQHEQEPGGGVALCPAHASEEAHARCAPCLVVQASGDAAACAACGDALGRGGARWGEQPLAAAGPSRARPLCARCAASTAWRCAPPASRAATWSGTRKTALCWYRRGRTASSRPPRPTCPTAS
jgi:hypothetical protein